MPKEEMLEEINKKLKSLENRGNLNNQIDILESFNFSGEANEVENTESDPFNIKFPESIITF